MTSSLFQGDVIDFSWRVAKISPLVNGPYFGMENDKGQVLFIFKMSYIWLVLKYFRSKFGLVYKNPKKIDVIIVEILAFKLQFDTLNKNNDILRHFQRNII